MGIHTGEKPYLCSHYNQDLLKKSNFKLHSRKHTGEKPHKYIYCKKVYSPKYHYEKHLIIHTLEKPYLCNLYDQTFLQWSNFKYYLRNHERGHTHFDQAGIGSSLTKMSTFIFIDCLLSRVYQIKQHPGKILGVQLLW